MLLCGLFALHFAQQTAGAWSAPGLPCALLASRAWSDQAKLGRNAPRGCEGVSAIQCKLEQRSVASYPVIASAAKQSRVFPRIGSGLLRCARNDHCGGGEPQSIPVP